MEDSYYKKQTLRPFLIVSGVFLAIAGAIQLHSAIVEIIALASDGYYNRWYSIAWTSTSAEYIAGEVSFFVGLISITTIIALIGRVFDNEKQQTRTTILLLVFFIALQALRDFHPDFITWGQEWGGLAVLLIYALIRGITFNNVSRQLNVPAVKYGGVLFSLYAWTFLITFIIVLITAVIYVATQSLEVGYYA
ncbi:MAG: hypothetical protein GPJ51_10210, partial [Candidatus Heimdallarchaeota archaeon]|nr:hypothetical protein [Candidatus Heimdallarchaeota archaeon]